MKVCHFYLDQDQQLRTASPALVAGLWEGQRPAPAGRAAERELRLVSVLRDSALLPRSLYLRRLPLTGGRFTPADRLVLRAFASADCVTPREAAGHHRAGWPADLARQLAVALDVPLAGLRVPVGWGGPLAVAAARNLTPRAALRYLR